MKAVDLFAGPGGWSVAAQELGIDETGVELDKTACETRRAVGFKTVLGDVRKYGPGLFPDTNGLIGSPPCPTFSSAGKGSGRREIDLIIDAIKNGTTFKASDPRTELVLEPLRWAKAAATLGMRYEWIALEQVPSVLPIWEAMAVELRQYGYNVDTGILKAEQYVVPQTRRRAVLVASLKPVQLPAPTHSSYHTQQPQKVDAGLLKWVSMAEALGWGATGRPSPTVTGGGTAAGGAEPFGNGARQGLKTAQAAGDWVLRSNYGTNGDPTKRGERRADQPSATVTSKINRFKWMGNTSITTTEAALLQTFPENFPWQGNKGQVYQQIGNAVPPLLAKAILQEVIKGGN